MLATTTRLGEAGRLVIPASHRKALGLKVGDEVVLVLEDDELCVMTPQTALRRAQAMVQQYVPRDRSLVGELILERREEVNGG